jgi:hypothetical protein
MGRKMKKIKLTRNKYALVDDEDYDELNQHKWYAHKTKNTSYVRRRQKTIHMHRVIMNPPSHLHIDHIDGNGLNNQKENLRICTGTQNQGNSKIRKDNTSDIKGVSWHKVNNKWVSHISINGKRKNLGYFSDKNEAKNAYTRAAKEHFGEFYSKGVSKI